MPSSQGMVQANLKNLFYSIIFSRDTKKLVFIPIFWYNTKNFWYGANFLVWCKFLTREKENLILKKKKKFFNKAIFSKMNKEDYLYNWAF